MSIQVSPHKHASTHKLRGWDGCLWVVKRSDTNHICGRFNTLAKGHMQRCICQLQYYLNQSRNTSQQHTLFRLLLESWDERTSAVLFSVCVHMQNIIPHLHSLDSQWLSQNCHEHPSKVCKSQHSCYKIQLAFTKQSKPHKPWDVMLTRGEKSV